MRLADAARREGYRLNTFDHLGSTNDEALRRAAAGDRGRLWVVAATQSAGRGRQGRIWSSPMGNLFATVLLVGRVEPMRAPHLSFVAGVALARAVNVVAGAVSGHVAIKWPNDILGNGAKLGGILVEGTWTSSRAFAVAVGFGVNCTSHPAGLPYRASDLSHFTGRPVSREAVFEALSDTFMETLSIWNDGEGFDAIRQLWIDLAMPIGTRMAVTVKGARLAGTYETMDVKGRLVLGTPDGTILIDVGDVALAETSVDHG